MSGALRKERLFLAASLAALIATGCTAQKQSSEEQPSASHAAAVANPSDFPLYPHSAVTSVVPIDSAQMYQALRAADPRADLPRDFRGHEVIAETNASLGTLTVWLAKLRTSPPQGLRLVSDGKWNVHARTSGGDQDAAAQFQSESGTRDVYVVVADPRAIKATMGPAFALIDTYSAVPGPLRGPIDEQAKKQFGYTVSEMLEPKSPAGAVIATLKRLQDQDRRAILVIDESKAR